MRFWWIPVVVVYHVVLAWYSIQNQAHGGRWFAWTLVWSLCPLWAIVSRYSKNLMLDSLIYDWLIVVSFNATLVWLGCSEKFGWVNWLGVGLAVVGFALVRGV